MVEYESLARAVGKGLVGRGDFSVFLLNDEKDAAHK